MLCHVPKRTEPDAGYAVNGEGAALQRNRSFDRGLSFDWLDFAEPDGSTSAIRHQVIPRDCPPWIVE